MNIDWIWHDINALACFLMGLRLLVFRKRGKHRLSISLLAYVLIMACGWITFSIMCGYYVQPDPAECVINIVLCIAVWRARGNLAKAVGGING